MRPTNLKICRIISIHWLTPLRPHCERQGSGDPTLCGGYPGPHCWVISYFFERDLSSIALAPRALAALATSVDTITFPSGANETCANLKWASPKGIPIIVRQHAIPAITWQIANQRPARIHHRRLINPVPVIRSFPTNCPSINSLPKGKAANTEMRNAAFANGIPIIVIANKRPAKNHTSQAITPPPKINHSRFPMNAIPAEPFFLSHYY